MNPEQELQGLEAQREVCQNLIAFIGKQPLCLDVDGKVIEGWHWLRASNKQMADNIKSLKAQIKLAKEESIKEPVQPEAESP